MRFLLDLSPYFLAIATLAIGVFDLFKEWSEEKRSWLKKSKGAALCIVGILSLVGVYQDNRDKTEQKAAATKLEGEVNAANKAQTDNTALYLKTYKELSDQVGDLKTQVKTDELQKKLSSVETQLENTQRALAPGPKATLEFSLDPPTPVPDGSTLVPLTETFLPVDDTGLVHFNFYILNNTDVDATDGEATLALCDGCKFEKEPQGSRKLSMAPETQRNFPFERVLPRTRTAFAIDASVPATGASIEIGFSYRCGTCVVATRFSKATIHLQRGFERPFQLLPAKKR